MINIDFDLNPAITADERISRAAAVEAYAYKTLMAMCGEDDFKAYQRLKSLCSREDYFNSGMLSLEQLTKVLTQLGVHENSPVLIQVFDDYDTLNQKKISIKKFCDGIFNRTVPPMKDPRLATIVTQVKSVLLSQGTGNLCGLVSTLKHMDTNGDNTISSEELKVGLKRFGVSLTDEELQTLLVTFAKGNRITIQEFLVALRGRLNARREKIVSLAFQQLDKKGSGIVRFADLCKLYDVGRSEAVVARGQSPDDALRAFISAWDRDGDGNITLSEFFDYYNTISASIDSDDYFETVVRNAWHFAGEDVTADTNIRVLAVLEDGSERVIPLENSIGVRRGDAITIKKRLLDQGIKATAIKLSM